VAHSIGRKTKSFTNHPLITIPKEKKRSPSCGGEKEGEGRAWPLLSRKDPGDKRKVDHLKGGSHHRKGKKGSDS